MLEIFDNSSRLLGIIKKPCSLANVDNSVSVNDITITGASNSSNKLKILVWDSMNSLKPQAEFVESGI